AAAPEMRIWLNDGADSFHPVRRSTGPKREVASYDRSEADPVAAEAAFLSLQRYAAFDLLVGLARPGQETHDWLVAAGFPEDELARLVEDPVTIDVIGLDYYPETEHDFDLSEGGESVVTTATAPVGLAATAL